MTKAERESASRRKKEADPVQQSKSGAAKPTYVSTDKKKMKEEITLDEKCWAGYTQKGMKKKGKKVVPNCVPVGEAKEEQGRSDYGKASVRNKRRFGKEGEPAIFDTTNERGKMIDKRREEHQQRQVKYEGVMDIVRKYTDKKKPEKKPEKAMDAGARARRKLARAHHAKYVSGSEDLVPDSIREGVSFQDFRKK